jgi:hypothetical protein
MHASINIHIALNYKPPKRGVRDTWESNPRRFVEQYAPHPERLKNMYFSYVVLLRALRKVRPPVRLPPPASRLARAACDDPATCAGCWVGLLYALRCGAAQPPRSHHDHPNQSEVGRRGCGALSSFRRA